MDKILVLFRGLPGAGKSTLAHSLCEVVNEADKYFDVFNGSKFDPKKLKIAHSWCKTTTDEQMVAGISPIGVANTFTQKWEMEDYEKLAKDHGYTVHHVIVENRHGNTSVHNVPPETIKKMSDRFEVRLGRES